MPSLEPRRRSRAQFEEEDDDRQSSTSDSSKRQRLSTNGAISEEDSDGGASSRRRQNRGGNRVPNGRPTVNGLGGGIGSGEFQPGAIVRVLVDNFVTYEHAEFSPGPNLNMVIGPNGTGKSSLVCAICLGLGYHPKHLGRASNVGEFVKYGKDTATIEIELQKRPHDSANHVIRLQIHKEDNARRWWLNGKESTHKAVQSLTSDLRIQIDNLCQFLPQDKVAEFAGLTPIQLLHETLRAAAPEHMIEWQTQLKKLHQRHKEVKGDVDMCAETLKGHETRQQGMQADVDRLREREAIQAKIQEFRDVRVIAEYNERFIESKKAKQRREDATRRLRELEEACGPALQSVNQKQEYQDKIKLVVGERKNILKEAEATGHQLLQAVERHDEKIKHVQNKRHAEDGSHASKKANLGKIRRTITDLEAKLQNKPPEFANEEWNKKIRQKEAILRENVARKRELDTQLEELMGPGREKTRQIAEHKASIERLNSQQGQKLAHLKKAHPDAAKGWEWLQDNRDEFEQEVFGPPMLTCSITDQRYSDHVQSLLANDDFCCFIAQTRNDHKKLSEQFYKKMSLSVTIRTCGSEFSSFRPAIPKEQLREMGLDAYAIDYLEGPEPVLAMLCSEKKLHVSGVALRETNPEQYEKIMRTERIPSWAAGTTMYRISRRREYGASAISTTTRKISAGRFWTNQPVDDTEKRTLERRVNELTDELDEMKRAVKETRQKMAEIVETEKPIQDEIRELKEQKNELQKAATQYASLGVKIDLEKQTLENIQKDLVECRTRIFEYSAQEDQLIIEKANMVLQHKEQLSHIRDAHQALLEAQIRLIEADSDVKGLEERNADIKQRLDHERAEVDNAKAEIARLKDEAHKVLRLVRQLLDKPDVDQEYYKNLAAGKTVEDIDNEVAAEESKLGLIHGVDPIVLRQFEQRAKTIQDLTRQKEEKTAKLESYNRKIEHIMQQWEPRVDEVISQINDAFSYNFEKINCAGEVNIHKDEDFEQWAIEIKVKFRENETLQQLNQHRQSGGERAVSTIFYLMALQSMAQAPFRVVDEINQGMDPRNERMVHERMVEIACREHTSQYFLITPKLLTGLRYDERMRVLCIASGEHMPREGQQLDFRKLIRIQRAIGAAA
ncbi:P-loop containing nucleoside triphosphate hydrolase protein [Whalleya microplaca]|nr:P-loop containing nucleoside triphosphate hydrolase protein [Whalleya microplaca]